MKFFSEKGEIAAKKSKIGNERSKKSKYYELKTRVEELGLEINESTKAWDKIKQLRLEENELTFEAEKKEDENSKIRCQKCGK